MDDNLDQWVTFYRVYHPGLRRWLLVQKRDGCTRTVPESTAWQPVQEPSRRVLTLAA